MITKFLFIFLLPALSLAMNFLCNPTLCPTSSRGDGICDPNCMVSFCNFDSNSTSNPRLNIEKSDCYQSCTNNYSCSHSDLGNGICDQNCNSPICGYDFGDCGYCSSNCKLYIGFLEDLNGNCTSSCENENCYYSLGSCQDCSSGCNSEMLGNNICDNSCNVLSCNYDFGDCNHNQCNPDCELWMIENNDCNDECNNLACNWDGGDCDCSPGCHSYMISNGVCDSICDVLACDYDNEDCQKCAPGCLKSMLGDGICDIACDVSDCLYDNYDCSCADGCNKDSYGQCQDSCMNSFCLYDTISSNSQCQNTNQILFALHYGFIFKNLISNVSPGNCTDATNCLSTEALDPSSCHANCKSNSCIYSWNKCTTYNCADSNCLICNSDLLGDCFQCNSNTYQFYGYCLTSCPSGHEAVNLLGNYPVCLNSKDYSTKDNSAIYYVTSKESTDIFGGNGSFNNPYASLGLALASIYNKYATIYLFNDGDHYLTCVDLSNPVSTVLSDVCNPLSRSFSITNLLISSYDDSTVVLKNKADSDLLLFTVASSTTLTIKNIAFNGKDLLSACPSSTNQYCTYCANITLNSDGYYYSDQDVKVADYLNASHCETYHTKQLFSVYSNAKLIMIDVNITDFRMELKSLIYSFGGNITFNNVNFDNIRCYWTDEAQQGKYSVVYFDSCEDSNYNCGSFEYINGVVSRLNNGYEYGSAQFSGFFCADKIRTIKLKNVTFINNIVYNPDIDSINYSLIKLSLFRSIEISHCSFIKNIVNYGLIYLSPTTLEFINDVNSKGELIDLLLYHIHIHDTIFESNFGNNAGILYAIYDSQLQKILLENLLINENGILSQPLMYVKNLYNNSQYIADTEISINDNNGNLVKVIFKKRDFIFKDSIITHNYSGAPLILYIEQLFNTHIKNLTIENNGSLNAQNINTIIWSYYVADSNLYTKKLVDSPDSIDFWALWVFVYCYNHEVSESAFINNTSQNYSPSIYYDTLNYANFTGITFEGNTGYYYDGICIIVQNTRNIKIINSTFKNNVNSLPDGSGVLYFDIIVKGVYIENTIISNNSAAYNPGIYLYDGSLILNNVTVESNKASSGLGAVYFQAYSGDGNHDIVIKNSVFKENRSINGKGGALYISGNRVYQDSVHLYAKDSVFISNLASIGSAIYISSNAILSNDSLIESCKFISNTADTKGTITILFQYGILNISNSLFISNQADSGSAFYFKNSKASSPGESKLILYYCNFTGNSGQNILRIDDVKIYSYIETVKCIFQNNEGIAINLVNSYWKDTESVIESSITTVGTVYLTSNSTADCEFTIFTNNTAKKHAGAISAEGNSYFKCNQCNFNQNSANYGGVIYFEQFSYFFIENSNFSNNFCTDRGAIIYIIGSENYSSLKNSKLYNNYADSEGLIYSITSNIKIDNCEIWDNTAGKITPGVYLTLSKAIIINSQFHDQQGNYGSFLYLTSDSELIVSNSSFMNGKSYISGGSIYALSSSLNLEKSVFKNSISNTGSAILSFSTSLNISQCQFLNIDSLESGGVISISGSEVFIEKSFFENFTNSAIEGSKIESLKVIETSFENSLGAVGGAISCINTDYAYIDSCTFKNNTSLYGGALYITFTLSKINSKPYEIISTKFENNTSSAGGAIFVDNININIELCRFQNNIAMSIDQTSGSNTDSGIGGAIKFGCSYSGKCDFYIFSNDFVGNKAEYDGGAIIWREVMPKLEKNFYENNLAEYGENIASYAVSMEIMNTNWTGGLKDLASGQQIKIPLIIALIDHLGSIVRTDDSSVGEIISLSKDVVLSGDLKVSAINGIFNFSSFIISALPGSNFSVEIQTNGIDASKSVKANDGLIYNSSIFVDVYLRECELGEATIGNDCVICPKDFYSLDTKDEQCSACPNEAICYGNYTMVPKPGYWRSDMLSKKLWSCPNSNACIGSDPQNISYTGNCDKGYTGNLCHSCSDGYYKIAKNECGKCESLSIVIIKTIGISLVFLIMCSIMVWTSKNSAYKPKSLSSIYIKILINYIQLVSLTTAFSFSWPNYVKNLHSAQNNSSYISGGQIFSFDCLFYYNEVLGDTAIFYQKLFIIAILPILIPFIAAIFWSSILICKRNFSLFIDDIITTSIIASFLVNPSLIKYYFSSYDCRELDYSKYWLAEDLSLQCWIGDHVFYTKNIAFPAILLWGVGIPTVCLISIIRNKDRLNNINVRIKYGFLFNGYNPRSYYWEFVIIYRKIIIICCTIFLEAVSVKIQALTTIFVLVSNLYLHCKIKPYNGDDLNRLEATSILASAITIYCGLYYLTGSLDSFTEFIFFIVIISVNLFFAIYWIIKAGNVYITMIILKIPFLRKKFRNQSYNFMSHLSSSFGESSYDLILSSSRMENLNQQDINFKEIKMKHLFLENLKGYENIIYENASENESSEEIDNDNASSKENSIEVENMESNSSNEKLIKTNEAEEENNKASLN